MKNKKLFILGGLALLIGVSYASANELKLDALKSESFKNISERLDDMAKDVGCGTPDNPIVLEYGDFFSVENKVSSIQNHYNYPASPTKLETESEIDTKTVGYQQISYRMSATDRYGQKAEKEKSVLYLIRDTKAPVIKLSGEEDTIFDDQAFDIVLEGEDSLMEEVKYGLLHPYYQLTLGKANCTASMVRIIDEQDF